MESGWQRVSSVLQESSKYSNWSLKCCSVYDLHSASDFLFLPSFSLLLVLVSPSVFQFPSKIQVFVYIFFFFLVSFIFTLCSAGTAESTRWRVIFFCSSNTRSGRLAGIGWSVCISKSQRISCVWFSRTNSGLCIYHVVVWSNFNLLYNS